MKRAWILLTLLAVCASPALAEESEDLAALAARITHYPTKFRLIAMGRAAVPALMAQVAAEDVRLVFESKSALHWIVNHARRDSVEVDALAQDLAGYLTSGAPGVALFAAELLGDLGCPQAVTALGGVTDNESLGVAAIEALGRIPGDAATNVLVKLGFSAKGERRAAVFRALGARKDDRAAAPLEQAAKQGHTAAIAALGRLGLRSTAGVLFGLCEEGTPGAFDALLAMAAQQPDTAMLARLYHHAKDDAQRGAVITAAADGPAPEREMHGAMSAAWSSPALRPATQRALLRWASRLDSKPAHLLYTRILREAEDDAIAMRALMGLGRCGIPGLEDLIESHLLSKSPAVRSTAIAALGGIPGYRPTATLITTLEEAVDPAEQSLVIRTLGRRAAAEIMHSLLTWMEEQAEGEVKRQAAEVVIAMAQEGPVDEARQVHLRLLTGGLVEPGLRGLVRTGDAAAVAPIVAALGSADERLRAIGGEALTAIAARLVAAREKPAAVQAYRAALDAGAMVENELRLLGEPIEITARAGRVGAWWLIGPFDAPDTAAWEKAEFPETAVELGKSTTVGSRTLRWAPVQVGGDDAIVDLDGRFTPNDNATAYAFTEIHVKKARPAVLKMGSDDGIRCWLNGKLVHTAFQPRGVTVDEDVVPVQLVEGRNTLLVKVCEIGGGWAFCLRIEDDKGRPLKFKMR